MPSKKTKGTVTAVASGETSTGVDPGAFQLPPYKEARPVMWFKQAEALMDMQNFTNPRFCLLLAQCALSEAQQEAVVHVLEKDLPASEAYTQLRAELTCMHQKSSWDRLGELFALPPCGDQKGTELLAAMEQHKPQEEDLWFRWLFFTRLPDWIQCQLAEDTSPVRVLAARVDELQRRAPAVTTEAAAPVAAAPAAEVAEVAHGHSASPRRTRREQPDEDQSSPGGSGTAETDPTPWKRAGICRFHWKYGASATECNHPCSWLEN
jgi:hypothetical protein